MHSIEYIYDKFLLGDRLTNEQLHSLWLHFSSTARYLLPLGPRFHLVATEALRVQEETRRMIDARALHKGCLNIAPWQRTISS